jgi:hypothetical protein
MNTSQELYQFETDCIESIPYLVQERSLAFLKRFVVRITNEYDNGYRAPRLVFGKGIPYRGVMYSYIDGPKIVLAPGQRNIYTVIHELTHFLGPADHGFGFKALYFHLLNEYCGYQAWYYFKMWKEDHEQTIR